MFWAQNLIEGVNEEYLSCVLKFRTFGKMSKKLWPNMLLSFINGQLGQLEKITFQKQKFEIGFLDLYIYIYGKI